MTILGRLGFGSIVAFGFAAALMAGCARTTQSPPSGGDVLPGILRSSVQIGVERGGAPFRWGSGVVITRSQSMAGTECLVLTAGHTLSRLSGADEIFVLLDRHQAQSAKVRAEVLAARDTPSWDLALLKIQSPSCVATRSGESPSLGDPIWVVGFPRGGDMTVGRGIVSQVSLTSGGPPSRFTIDASTSHGSSGAGVFDSRTGGLVGLVEAFGTARVPILGGGSAPHVDIPMPGMTYVTPVNRLDEFLRATAGERLLVGWSDKAGDLMLPVR